MSVSTTASLDAGESGDWGCGEGVGGPLGEKTSLWKAFEYKSGSTGDVCGIFGGGAQKWDGGQGGLTDPEHLHGLR